MRNGQSVHLFNPLSNPLSAFAYPPQILYNAALKVLS
jgi:hypothetical protein